MKYCLVYKFSNIFHEHHVLQKAIYLSNFCFASNFFFFFWGLQWFCQLYWFLAFVWNVRLCLYKLKMKGLGWRSIRTSSGSKWKSIRKFWSPHDHSHELWALMLATWRLMFVDGTSQVWQGMVRCSTTTWRQLSEKALESRRPYEVSSEFKFYVKK